MHPSNPITPSVLLALCNLDEAASVALLRAHAFAAAGGAALNVVRVVPSRPASPQAEEEVAAFCSAALPHPVSLERCRVVHGDFVAEVTAVVKEARAGLAVLPVAQWAGRAAELLVQFAHVPVLVARLPRTPCVVGATSLEHTGFPVLSQVAELQVRLEGKAVLVHSIEPTGGGDIGSRLDRLRGAAGEVLAWAEVVVVRHPSTAHAILKVAREHDSDLIVVGAPRRPGRLFGRSVTEEVVARARRSVWVTPVDA